jgi:hypothetical protein
MICLGGFCFSSALYALIIRLTQAGIVSFCTDGVSCGTTETGCFTDEQQDVPNRYINAGRNKDLNRFM